MKTAGLFPQGSRVLSSQSAGPRVSESVSPRSSRSARRRPSSARA
jgi:hypothetical protein